VTHSQLPAFVTGPPMQHCSPHGRQTPKAPVPHPICKQSTSFERCSDRNAPSSRSHMGAVTSGATSAHSVATAAHSSRNEPSTQAGSAARSPQATMRPESHADAESPRSRRHASQRAAALGRRRGPTVSHARRVSEAPRHASPESTPQSGGGPSSLAHPVGASRGASLDARGVAFTAVGRAATLAG
jgi:hypothetical protein